MTPQRIQLRRTKGWRKPVGAVVVARPTKWGNPVTIEMLRADYPESDIESLRRMAASDFRGLVDGRFEPFDDMPPPPTIDEIQAELAGRDLACWCPLTSACHADVLLELANP